MHKVSVIRHISAAPDAVWRVLDDFGSVYAYHPLVKSSTVTNSVERGVGAERVCNFHDGNRIHERITKYEPEKNYTVEITDPGKFPLQRAVAQLQVQPAPRDGSRVSFEMEFQPKFGPFGWLMAQLIMKNRFGKVLSRVLEGIETHIKTGQIVNQNGLVTAVS